MELFKAHHQWASRPSDERFTNLTEMHMMCLAYRDVARESVIPYSQIRVEAVGDDLQLVGKTGVQASLTHWSMGQLSQRAGAPAGYLRQLPTTLAAQNMNHGLKARGDESATDQAHLMFHQNGSLVLRSATSDVYSRIWNSDITERLIAFQQQNPSWKNPLAYAVNGAGGFGAITPGREMVPSGLYASDHDMFAFMVDESKTLAGSPKGLNRGFFFWNSEVGAGSFGGMTFLYDRVCGNNIVWGAENVTEMRIRHVGNADARAFSQLSIELKKYANESASETEAQIVKARSFELGATKEQALDALMSAVAKLRLPELTRAKVSEGLGVAEKREDRYGNPYSLWGAIGGLTEASQTIPFADQRNKIDRAAGKLMRIAF